MYSLPGSYNGGNRDRVMTNVCVFINAVLIVYILYRLRLYEKALHSIVQLLKLYDKELEGLEEPNEFKSRKNGKDGVEAEHAGAEDKDSTVQS